MKASGAVEVYHWGTCRIGIYIVNYNSTTCEGKGELRHLLDTRRQGWRFAVPGGVPV